MKHKDDDEREREREAKRAEERRTVTIVWGVIIASVAFAASVAMIEKEKHHEKNKSEEGHARTTDPTTEDTATAPVPIAPPEWIRVPSCTCVARGGGAKNTFILEAPTPPHTTWYMDWMQASAMLDSHHVLVLGKGEAGANAVLPPRADVTTLRMAFACDGDIAVLVSGNLASGWAGNDNGELIWTTKLPAPIAAPAIDAAVTPSPPEAALDVACTHVLSVTGGLAALTLTNGRHVSLAMHDGALH
jgi:hypothetical protein